MTNNRLMIRLIDVALIILLGFIAISRMKTEYIDLPAAGKAEAPKNKTHVAKVHVYKSRYIFVDGKRKRSYKTLRSLESALISANSRYLRRGSQLVMNIEPHRASLMQSLINVLDICQRNNIEKNLDYEKIQ